MAPVIVADGACQKNFVAKLTDMDRKIQGRSAEVLPLANDVPENFSHTYDSHAELRHSLRILTVGSGWKVLFQVCSKVPL